MRGNSVRERAARLRERAGAGAPEAGVPEAREGRRSKILMPVWEDAFSTKDNWGQTRVLEMEVPVWLLSPACTSDSGVLETFPQ